MSVELTTYATATAANAYRPALA